MYTIILPFIVIRSHVTNQPFLISLIVVSWLADYIIILICLDINPVGDCPEMTILGCRSSLLVIIMLNKNNLAVKKCEANQKQRWLQVLQKVHEIVYKSLISTFWQTFVPIGTED